MKNYFDIPSDESWKIIHGDVHRNYIKAEHRHLKAKDGFTYCPRCGQEISWDSMHETWIDQSTTVMVICEPCWQALSPEGRWPWYRMRIASWQQSTTQDYEEKAREIKAAVWKEAGETEDATLAPLRLKGGGGMEDDSD